MVVGIYAPETKVSGIIIMELIVWNEGELRETKTAVTSKHITLFVTDHGKGIAEDDKL